MADEDGGRQWVVEPPPAAGEVSLYLACGEDVELSAEQQEALGALLRALESADPEVVGLDSNCTGNYSRCYGLTCPKVKCGTLICLPLGKPANLVSAPGWSLMGSFGPAAQ